MRALIMVGPWELAVQERPEPEPGPTDALLEIIATGICGSDLHGYTGENGRRHAGQVMGHETVARVLIDRTGAHAAGALVTVNPVIGCRDCPACAGGNPQRCPRRTVIGVARELSAAFAERMVAPSHNLVPLTDEIPAELGSLVEPLAVGLHAVRRGEVRADDTVLVLGGGPIGQAVALAARRAGATIIQVVEPDETRRALVSRLGFATGPIDGQAATVVVDAVGTSQTLQAAFEASALGARIVLVGMGSPRVELNAYAISTEERTVLGSFSYSEAEFRDTAAWVGAHAGELGVLIDARVSLDEAPDTFRALAARELAASKVLVLPKGAQP